MQGLIFVVVVVVVVVVVNWKKCKQVFLQWEGQQILLAPHQQTFLM